VIDKTAARAITRWVDASFISQSSEGSSWLPAWRTIAAAAPCNL
jgi:hypothetical protein